MEYQDAEMWQQGALTPTQEPRTYTPTPSSRSSKSALPETPETTRVSEPPTQPPKPPKIRIKRRRAIFPPQGQSNTLTSSDDFALPTIELPKAMSDGPQQSLIITPNSSLHQGFLAPSSSSSLGRLISPPKTPTQQIVTGIDATEAIENGFSVTSYKQGEDIERPLSALSMFSDSSASSRSSSDTAPSFGGSCTSPESESSDPFVFNELAGKAPLMSSPLKSPNSQHRRKRQKRHQRVKWTDEMDEHLWVTYMAYLSDPTVTPFKTLPGSPPPLGVCYRVAREAKKSWKGTRLVRQPISEDRSPYVFTSLDATVMRETSAPPRFARETKSPDTIRARPSSQRSHSSTEISHKQAVSWPRSNSSTRRRLRELCKHKPMLPPHYQRLMQTRTPSPFESSSSKTWRRSSRLSPQLGSSEYESAFSTRDLNFTLGTSTSTTMQPGGPLAQLASDDQLSRQSDVPSSNHSSVRGAHQKSQSLQLGLGLGADQLGSMRQLASPFQGVPRREESRFENAKVREEAKASSGHDPADDLVAAVKLDSPLQIHAPRPMSGSMKRRAEYQLGEELIADDVDARRDFLEDLFRNPLTDGHRRVRSRGFSLGAMRQVTQPHRHLSDLFTPPSVAEQSSAADADSEVVNKPDEHNINKSTDNYTLAPPNIKHHARRLGSPFAPNSSSGFSNTFPRSLLPHGLDSISGGRDHQQHTDEQGYNSDQTPSTVKRA